MPPPFLVDVDGNPHPIHFQRLVPGHGSNVRGPPRPAPQPPPTPREDVPPLLAEIEAAEAAEAQGRLPLPGLSLKIIFVISISIAQMWSNCEELNFLNILQLIHIFVQWIVPGPQALFLLLKEL